MNMLNFCTLFDSAYLSRGLAMYDSLKEHCKSFHLYIFAFDDKCLNIIKYLALENVTVISLKEFEDKELLSVKPTRSRAEYCWTCTPSTISYVIKTYNVDNCTYLDSDLYFFSSPQILLDEMAANESILITPHRYTKKYDKSDTSGIYCVQFVTFKNDINGMKALDWWRNACLEWCYDRMEDGKFGDQKYLNDWPARFNGVHVLQHTGGGVAPWNMQQYAFYQDQDRVMGTVLTTRQHFEIIFFHFHTLTYISPSYFSPRPYYRRNDSVITFIFKPYIEKIKQLRELYPQLKETEKYLRGWKLLMYFTRVFIYQGLKEIRFVQLTNNK